MQATNGIRPTGKLGSPVALIAEDEVLIRLALAEYLRSQGFDVLEAATGEEAQLILQAVDDIEIVISDINMARPGEGIELAQWMALHTPDLPMILTSGSRSSAVAIAGCKNVTDFVAKPYVEKELERLIRARIGQRDSSSK